MSCSRPWCLPRCRVQAIQTLWDSEALALDLQPQSAASRVSDLFYNAPNSNPTRLAACMLC